MNGNPALQFTDARTREEINQLGLWVFLATVAMLFAAFTSAYLVRQGGDDWSRIRLPSMLWASTIVLVLSSIALEGGRRWGARGGWTRASAALAAAVALGIAFLAAQVLAWRALTTAGVYLPATPHSSFFFMMTGAHAIHVVAALVVLSWGALRTCDGTGRRDLRRWQSTMTACATFWHFLLGVWVYLFALLAFL
jgi:cytochrome c oxidase subunit 3